MLDVMHVDERDSGVDRVGNKKLLDSSILNFVRQHKRYQPYNKIATSYGVNVPAALTWHFSAAVGTVLFE
ncbi:MAG: hypothetical protein GY820_03450 [Gammaproteobacteria bacterium]|nr:hypothetical protein [Gammaproteobacteria bacterium]